MCGIAGFVTLGQDQTWMATVVQKMGQQLAHRGPDSSGVYVDSAAGLAFSHQRLSILDLSAEGNQPMQSHCGRYVIIFNGEVYNHLLLRERLYSREIPWRGHSDTETLLAAISCLGLEAALQLTVGMFAFALWDRQEQVLHLARDRMGEKPLYYGWSGGSFMFGSELKALKVHPRWHAEINREALTLFLRYKYVPAPLSIYQNIFKLPPGHLLSLSLTGNRKESLTAYWSVYQAAQSGLAYPFVGDEVEAAEALDRLLRQSVQQQITADVPVGAFLSGGYDSSLISALMCAQSRGRSKTFTIGVGDSRYNEAIYAQEVAQHLGSEHHELYVSPSDVMETIPKMPLLYDEPFSDASQVPTFLVAQLARQHVTVSLSGDGGDELFGGYNRYTWGPAIWRRIGWTPQWGRQQAAMLLQTLSPQTWDKLFSSLGRWLPAAWRYMTPGEHIHKMAGVLAARDAEDLYLRLVSHWKQPSQVVKQGREPAFDASDSQLLQDFPNFCDRMMYRDAVTYLPDDILVKVDRASMGVSLEARVPFLDHRIVEFAWSIPQTMKIRNGQGKWLLRQVLYKYVPPKLVDRPKQGFGLPIDEWLRGGLREWAESLLAEDRLRQEDFFNPASIRQKWQEHLSGKHNWQYDLWDILMFQAWREQA